MLTKIKAFIRKRRGRDTVDGVVGQFQKTIADLRALETEATDRGWQLEDQINSLKEQQVAADNEAAKAARVAEKLEAIFD